MKPEPVSIGTRMKILVVHAHPEPKSFNTAMCHAAVEELTLLGHSVQVSDLYAMEFNAVASRHDFHARAGADYCVYALEQRHAVQHGTLAPDIQAELDKLLWCDLLVLVFPMFWFSTPAIMKGWIDRVLVSGKVYGGKRFYEKGGLAGKQALVCTSLGGQQHMFDADGVHGPILDMLKPLLQGTLAYVGMQVLEPFIAWHVPYISHEERLKILEAWRTRLQDLGHAAVLRTPSLDDFDSRLVPLKTAR
jgi:NAD(P)H dehydrogenase (quinone)